MKLKLVSVNIEGKKHLDSVREFLVREDADVVCLMEACEREVVEMTKDLYPYHEYMANDVLGNISGDHSLEPTGVMMLSKTEIREVEKFSCGEPPRDRFVEKGSGTHAPAVLLGNIQGMQIGATHFTWTKKGLVDEIQRKHTQMLLDYLSGRGELVLCGDFNIPRGNEMYMEIAKKYKDNIPPEITTTLDPILHYANKLEPGKLKLVVDYVWSTPKYEVSGVRVVSGVSDHCAVVCTVTKI